MSRRLPFIPYREQYRLPQWQKKRATILAYSKCRCQVCGAQDQQIHIHHSYYIKGRRVWDYPNCSLIAVCWSCHERIHGKDTDQAEPRASEPDAATPAIRAADVKIEPPATNIDFESLLARLGQI